MARIRIIKREQDQEAVALRKEIGRLDKNNDDLEERNRILRQNFKDVQIKLKQLENKPNAKESSTFLDSVMNALLNPRLSPVFSVRTAQGVADIICTMVIKDEKKNVLISTSTEPFEVREDEEMLVHFTVTNNQ